jgi:hypothetical protein
MICYSSQDIKGIKLRRMRWVGPVACMTEKRKACRVLLRKLEGMYLEDMCVEWDNIKMYPKELGWENVG